MNTQETNLFVVRKNEMPRKFLKSKDKDAIIYWLGMIYDKVVDSHLFEYTHFAMVYFSFLYLKINVTLVIKLCL